MLPRCYCMGAQAARVESRGRALGWRGAGFARARSRPAAIQAPEIGFALSGTLGLSGACCLSQDALRSSRLSSSLTAKAALLGVRGLVARGTDSFSVRAFKASRLRVKLLQTLAAHGPEMVTVSFG